MDWPAKVRRVVRVPPPPPAPVIAPSDASPTTPELSIPMVVAIAVRPVRSVQVPVALSASASTPLTLGRPPPPLLPPDVGPTRMFPLPPPLPPASPSSTTQPLRRALDMFTRTRSRRTFFSGCHRIRYTFIPTRSQRSTSFNVRVGLTRCSPLTQG